MKLNTKEACKYLGIGLEKVRTLAKTGVLAHTKERLGAPNGGQGFMFELVVLDQWLSENERVNQKVIIPRERVVKYSPEEYNKLLRAELGIPYKPLTYRHQEL
jgi:excisionase family DNA binding protein